jgi:hypothetical protein
VGQIFSCIFIMQLDFSLTFLVHWSLRSKSVQLFQIVDTKMWTMLINLSWHITLRGAAKRDQMK